MQQIKAIADMTEETQRFADQKTFLARLQAGKEHREQQKQLQRTGGAVKKRNQKHGAADAQQAPGFLVLKKLQFVREQIGRETSGREIGDGALMAQNGP